MPSALMNCWLKEPDERQARELAVIRSRFGSVEVTIAGWRPSDPALEKVRLASLFQSGGLSLGRAHKAVVRLLDGKTVMVRLPFSTESEAQAELAKLGARVLEHSQST